VKTPVGETAATSRRKRKDTRETTRFYQNTRPNLMIVRAASVVDAAVQTAIHERPTGSRDAKARVVFQLLPPGEIHAHPGQREPNSRQDYRVEPVTRSNMGASFRTSRKLKGEKRPRMWNFKRRACRPARQS
jgi:hypothetical protein